MMKSYGIYNVRHKKPKLKLRFFELKNKIIFQQKHVQSHSRLIRPYVAIL